MRIRKPPPDPVAVVELDDRDMRSISRRHPELSGHRAVLAVAAPDDLRPALSELLNEILTANKVGQRRRMEQLVDLLSSRLEIPRAKLVDEARNEAKFRERVIRDFGALRASDVSEL